MGWTLLVPKKCSKRVLNYPVRQDIYFFIFVRCSTKLSPFLRHGGLTRISPGTHISPIHISHHLNPIYLTTPKMLLPLLFLLPFTLARPWLPTDPCPTTTHSIISSDPCSGFYTRTVQDSPNYPATTPQLSTLRNIHTALINCPNVTALDIRVTLSGCSDWPERWTFPFNPAGGEIYPSLKRVKLEGYKFDSREQVVLEPRLKRWIKDVVHFGFWGQVVSLLDLKSNLDLWIQAMD
jgi:hypothetical protein